MRLSFLPSLLFVVVLSGCAVARDEAIDSSEQHAAAREPVRKTTLASDFGHADVVLGSEPMARLIVQNVSSVPRCGAGIPLLGANEAGRLLVDGVKLASLVPSFTEAEHDDFQRDCLGDMPFEVVGAPSRPTPDQLLLALDLVPEPETLRLEVVDARDTALFTAGDLATFVDQVRDQTATPAAALDPYSELLRQEEILDRVIASSPPTYIARKYTATTVERWDFADGRCEIVTTTDANVTLLSPSHFGVELALSRLDSRVETHDSACTVPAR